MNTKSTIFLILMALLTTVTLAGSIWLPMYLAGGNSINPSRILPANNDALLAAVMFGVFLLGGALWD